MNLSDLGLPIPSSNASGLIISKQFYVPSLSVVTYPLDTFAAFPYTITYVYQFQTSSGTVDAVIKINGTARLICGWVDLEFYVRCPTGWASEW